MPTQNRLRSVSFSNSTPSKWNHCDSFTTGNRILRSARTTKQQEKPFEYRAEDDRDTVTDFSRGRPRCSSISPAPLRDPIAPGIYTRVKKREEEEETTSLSSLETASAPVAEPLLIAPREWQEQEQISERTVPIQDEDLRSTSSSSVFGLPIIQEFILDSHLTITIEGRKRHDGKVFVYCILCILTGGILYLVSKWLPRIRCTLTTKQSSLAQSTHILATSSFGKHDFISVKRSYYGNVLREVFGRQRVRENIIYDQSDEDSDSESVEDDVDKGDAESGKNGKNRPRATMTDAANEQATVPVAGDSHFETGELAVSTNSTDEEDGALLVYTNLDQPPELLTTDAQHIVVEDTSSLSSSFVKTKGVPSPSDYLYYFEYRCIRFIYHPLTGRYFESSQWDAFQYHPEWKKGLSYTESEQRQVIYGANILQIQRKPILRLLIDEILHPFNVFQIFSIILWCFDNYFAYAGAILLISAYHIILAVYITRKNTDRLINMSRYICDINVFRQGLWKTICSDELVPGDVIELDMALTNPLPCDAVLFEGDCIVNESMLTGESTPVSKSSIEKDTWNKLVADGLHLQYCPLSSTSTLIDRSVVFGGTRLSRVRNQAGGGMAKAIVLKIGFSTAKGLLIRNILFPRPTDFKFYRDSMRFVGVFCIIALVGFCATLVMFIRAGVSASTIVLRALDLISVVVPPALPACMAIGTTFAMAKLKKRQIFCTSPLRINVCGKIDMFCFDKTGTLTEEGLDVFGMHAVRVTANDDVQLDNLLSRPVHSDISREYHDDGNDIVNNYTELLLCAMATCHSVKVMEGQLIGDPLDVKMFEFTEFQIDDSGKSFVDANVPTMTTIVRPASFSRFKTAHALPELVSVRTFEFQPTLRRMSILVKHVGMTTIDGYFAFAKGAPEVIRDICKPETIPSNFDHVLTHYAQNGYRVIALAFKPCTLFSWTRALKLKREEVENELSLLGFLVFENRIKQSTGNTVQTLSSAGFRITVSTGDNILTAISVAKECHIVPKNAEVYLPRIPSPGDFIETAGGSGEQSTVIWESVLDPNRRLDCVTLRPVHNKPCRRNYSNDHQAIVLGCTGHILEYLLDHCNSDIFEAVLMHCHVYARMSPPQKQRLVECFQKLDYCVAFCGDGANDSAALQAADVGLSLSDAEASLSAPFTCKVPDIQCTVDLALEGRSALATSFSCFKFMALFSLTQFTSVTLLYSVATNLSDWQYFYIDLVTILPLAICIARMDASDVLTKSQPTAELLSRSVLTSVVGQAIVQCLFQCIVYLSALQRGFGNVSIASLDAKDDFVSSQIGTTIFTFSTFQYLFIALLYSTNRPYQKFVFQNSIFMVVSGILFLFNSYLLLYPDTLISSVMQFEYLPAEYRLFLLIMVIASLVGSCIAEFFALPLITKFLFILAPGKKRTAKYFKELLIGEAKNYNDPV